MKFVRKHRLSQRAKKPPVVAEQVYGAAKYQAITDTIPNARFSTSLTLNGIIQDTPAIGADSWNPVGIDVAGVIEASPTGPTSIFGLKGGFAGRLLLIVNIATSSACTLDFYHDNATTASDGFIAANLVVSVQPGGSVLLWYDDTTPGYTAPLGRWRIIAVDPSFSMHPNYFYFPLDPGGLNPPNGLDGWVKYDSTNHELEIGDTASGDHHVLVIAAEGTTPAAVSTAGDQGVSSHPMAAHHDHVHAHEAAHVAHDTVWDAKGDLVVGTGADTAAKLVVGTDGYLLTADSTASTGLSWSASASGTYTEYIWILPGDYLYDDMVALAVGTTPHLIGVARSNEADLRAGMYATFGVPGNWDGVTAMSMTLVWYSSGTGGNVVWTAQVDNLASGEDPIGPPTNLSAGGAGGVAVAEATTSTYTTITTWDSAAAATFMPTHKGDTIAINVERNANHANDTSTNNARLLAIRINYVATGVKGDAGATGGLNVFGDGSDGSVHFTAAGTTPDASTGATRSGTTWTLVRDIFCTDLVVDSGVTVDTSQYRIFATGTLTNSGHIHADGVSASGTTAGTGETRGTYAGPASAGGAGLASGTTTVSGNGGSTGGAATAHYSPGKSLGSGSGGGAGGNSNGGAGGTNGATTNFVGIPRDAVSVLRGVWYAASSTATGGASFLIPYGGTGGGGGGRTTGGTATATGAGGGGAGVLLIAAHTLDNSAGSITANGGNGSNATGGTCSAGGGGGGGGGAVFLVSVTLTSGTQTATGGTAGSGLNGASAAANGTDGVVITISL